jgi:hypothetical protein
MSTTSPFQRPAQSASRVIPGGHGGPFRRFTLARLDNITADGPSNIRTRKIIGFGTDYLYAAPRQAENARVESQEKIRKLQD